MAQQLDNYLSSPKNQLGFFFTLHYTQNNSKWIHVLKVKNKAVQCPGRKSTGEENLCEFGLSKDFSVVARKYDL